ncbi:hypothetical protein BDW75DRAFT_232747 [Aspergillus navahoensis]
MIAVSVIPVVMDLENGASRPEFRDIQPWDLKHPIAVYSNRDGKHLPVFYDATTQEYYLFTIEGAVLLHKTPKLTITKKQAREVHNQIFSSLFGRATETEIECRPTTFFQFWEDKSVRCLGSSGPLCASDQWIIYLRPSLDWLVGHRFYCSKCTSYRFPPTSPAVGDTDKTDNTLTFSQPISPAEYSAGVFGRCLRPDKKNLNTPRAYQLLSQIFHKPTIDSILIPQAYMVSNLLRDSLFVAVRPFPRATTESWADCFGVGGEQPQQGTGGGLGVGGRVAAGAAIVGAGAMVG